MKFDLREALASVMASVMLLSFVIVVVGGIGGYLMLATLVDNWIAAHFALHPVLVFVVTVIVFIGVPQFILGGLGVFKDRDQGER